MCLNWFRQAGIEFVAGAKQEELAELAQEAKMRRMLQASGGDGGNNSSVRSGMGLDIVDFVSLVRSNVDDLPEGRLLFFTTNHVDEMPIELVELVDKQGMRVSFPNATDVSTSHRSSSYRAASSRTSAGVICTTSLHWAHYTFARVRAACRNDSVHD